MKASWMSILAYASAIAVIVWGLWLAKRVWHEQQLKAKDDYAADVQRDLTLYRMGQTPRRYTRVANGSASPLYRGDWRG